MHEIKKKKNFYKKLRKKIRKKIGIEVEISTTKRTKLYFLGKERK